MQVCASVSPKGVRVREVGSAGGIFDFGLLGERVADACPKVLGRRLGDDGGIDKDMRRRVGVRVALEGVVVVVDDGDCRGARAVGADGRHGEHGLVELLGGRLDGVDRLAAADGERDVGGAKRVIAHESVDRGLRGVGAVDDLIENLDARVGQGLADLRGSRGERPCTADQDDRLRVVGREDVRDRFKAILSDCVAAHLDGSHGSS